ncbi:MAG: hypothetical protein UT05_C0017G0001, partial [Parcubacteria group bacterium GW2011_GWF2_38_76]
IAEPPVAVVYILNLKLYVLSATVTPAEVVSLPWYESSLENWEVAEYAGETTNKDKITTNAVKALATLILNIINL